MKINFESTVTILITSLTGLFVSRAVDPQENLFYAIIITVIIVLGLLLIKEMLVYVMLSRSFQSKIQGEWIEYKRMGGLNSELNEELPDALVTISYAKIDFNKIDREVIFTGYAFNKKADLIAEWRSNYIKFDKKRHMLTYMYEGHIFGSGGSPKTGIGFIRFFPVVKGKYKYGSGNFRGAGNNYVPVYHLMKRIDREQVFELVGKKRIETMDDVQKLIRNFDIDKNHELFPQNFSG